jgi:hypothetical protein
MENRKTSRRIEPSTITQNRPLGNHLTLLLRNKDSIDKGLVDETKSKKTEKAQKMDEVQEKGAVRLD